MSDKLASIIRVATEVRLNLVLLETLVDEIYPSGSVVHVNHVRYRGQAIVTRNDSKEAKLAVILENGNVWHYELETITPIKHRRNWLLWIIRRKRSDAAKLAARTRKNRAAEKKIKDYIEDKPTNAKGEE